jgi:predicted DNA binding protein
MNEALQSVDSAYNNNKAKIVEKFDSISPADQEKLVALTEEQLSALRNADARARD